MEGLKYNGETNCGTSIIPMWCVCVCMCK